MPFFSTVAYEAPAPLAFTRSALLLNTVEQVHSLRAFIITESIVATPLGFSKKSQGFHFVRTAFDSFSLEQITPIFERSAFERTAFDSFNLEQITFICEFSLETEIRDKEKATRFTKAVCL